MALIRHPRLRALSSEHHHALVLARRISQAAQLDRELVVETIARFTREIDPHFRLEEEGLLPALEAVGEAELVARTREDHRRLRELLAAAGAGDSAALRDFAALLEEHVRFEERVLFETAQARLQLDGVL